ncbi:MAG: hypothetical protein U1C33_07995, partial [Candidatus Cloacimonadaceae bacterium]|nr:hypothetical protein [Candidatus Cloacimonadaceae bacterium]
FISGQTSDRRHVVGISELFPNGIISKVTYSLVRNHPVWLFEITSDLPKVDWFGLIEADLEKLIKMKEAYGEKEAAEKERAASASGRTTVVQRVQKQAAQIVERERAPDKITATFFGSIPSEYRLVPTDSELASVEKTELEEYNQFIAATGRGSTWHYRDLGIKFMRNYSGSVLSPYVRWNLAHRYYVDKEYTFALQSLEPLVRNQNQHYPYALVLGARIEIAAGSGRYREYYNILRNDYMTHRLVNLFREDMKKAEEGR